MRLVPFALSVVLLAGCATAATKPGRPADVVTAFYTTYQPMERYGLPAPENMKKLGPFLSRRLVSLLDQAKKEQEDFAKKYPDEKPPFVDGDLFSSLFEGFRAFTVGEAETLAVDRWKVPIDFSYWETSKQEDAVKWRDYAIVVPEGDGLVIDDFQFGGTWDFAQKGTLSENLSTAP